MTSYQAIVRASRLDRADADMIRRHVSTCPSCAACEGCRMSNCRTLDAIVEFMVETKFPREHAVSAEEYVEQMKDFTLDLGEDYEP